MGYERFVLFLYTAYTDHTGDEIWLRTRATCAQYIYICKSRCLRKILYDIQ